MKKVLTRATMFIGVLLLVGLAASTTRADIVFASGGSNFGDENVLAVNNQIGNTVIGTTQNPMFTVRFTSPSTLSTQSGGQARFIGPFNQITITPDSGFGFQAISFNAFNIAGSGTATVLVTGINQFGASESMSFSVGPGQNFIQLTGTQGQIITSVVLNSTNTIGDLRQVRIDGATVLQGQIPEPASMLLLGTGLAGLASAIRTRWNKKK